MRWYGGGRQKGRLSLVPRSDGFSASCAVELRVGELDKSGRGAESSQRQRWLWQGLLVSVKG